MLQREMELMEGPSRSADIVLISRAFTLRGARLSGWVITVNMRGAMSEDDSHDIEVDMNHHEKAETPNVLVTSSLGPCIGIGVLDHDSGRGYLCHYGSLANRPEGRAFFDDVKDCSQNVSIVIAGGDTSEDGPEGTDVITRRNEMISRLSKLFPKVTPEIHWSPAGGSSWIKVDLKAGGITHGLD